MNEFGIHSVSTREIANREGITEAAIFRHFPKKNDLFLAVLDYFSKYDNDIYQSIKLKELDPFDSIKYYVEMYSSYFQNYPAITVILHSMDEMRYNKDLAGKIQEMMHTRVHFFKEFIHIGQENGDISAELDADILVSIFLGTLDEIDLKWRLENYSFPLKDTCLKAINALIDAFKTNRKGV